ncbi:transmembrane amino acid transporter protein-domain-containing protein [Dunaliella salina]|uniref:Transmembrane amino acid transporter protein-domain-containing protein n=1 Tax=Dunaliella salina TaxID=3046 RepID=A0ABQ7FZ60_DUNSA|nr:transmembrane amino acid transporter protein-domain-containing protein [Dunaliella salina]|eukprot:KAF5827638.1 transmembrane amino acid transporter protein-domain-containing protein [Dunaliella salina]
MASTTVVLVEEDAQLQRKKDTKSHLLYSAVVTLSLGVLGSTVLPVPYAFSKLGVFGGCFTAALVGLANDLTCTWLVQAAAMTGRYTYEGLADFAGGPKAKVVTQVSLLLLLFGTVSGGMAFLADMGRSMAALCAEGLSKAQSMGPEEGASAPLLISWRSLMMRLCEDGRPVMCVLYPLSLRRHIRALEKAGTLGVGVVLVLVALIVTKAIASGMPAVRNGELPLGWGPGGLESMPEGFAILGFAFYMQPMLMPLLSEMPEGPEGAQISETAVHIVLWGVACGVYGSMGLFGAATYGAETASNIMLNDVLGNAPVYAGMALYVSLLLYLCTGMVTSVHALRASVDVALMGESAPFAWGRWVTETTVLQAAALGVAYAFPSAAEKIFALTGCTAVCVVCYCVPVYIHLTLKSRLHKAALAAGMPVSPMLTRHMPHAACSVQQEPPGQPQALLSEQQPQQPSPEPHHPTAPLLSPSAEAHADLTPEKGTTKACGVGIGQGKQAGGHRMGMLVMQGGVAAHQHVLEGAAQQSVLLLQGTAQQNVTSGKHPPAFLGPGGDQYAGTDSGWEGTCHQEGIVQQHSNGDLRTPLLGPRHRHSPPSARLYDPHRALWWRLLTEWLLPVLVVAVGVSCSAAGLWVSIRDS